MSETREQAQAMEHLPAWAKKRIANYGEQAAFTWPETRRFILESMSFERERIVEKVKATKSVCPNGPRYEGYNQAVADVLAAIEGED